MSDLVEQAGCQDWRELARKAGIAESTLRPWATGKPVPLDSKVPAKLAAVTGLSLKAIHQGFLQQEMAGVDDWLKSRGVTEHLYVRQE